MRHLLVALAAALVITACSGAAVESSRAAVAPPPIGTTLVPPRLVVTSSTGSASTSSQVNSQVGGTAEAPSSPVATADAVAAVRPTVPPADAERPFDVFVPSGYDDSVAAPLVVMLHGYTSSGALHEQYFRLRPVAEDRGFLYVHPDGTTDDRGDRFWNATDACCNLSGSDVDDVAYLTRVIETVRATYQVDPARIYLIGHSNGGFMSYRMACERSDLIAAVVSVAGATLSDTTACRPSQPVSVLQIHGTADSVIDDDGGTILGHEYPSAQVTVASWAAYNSCRGPLDTSASRIDLDAVIDGAETRVSTYAGCGQGVGVELWTIDGGRHSPAISSTFFDEVLDFLFAHPKV